MVPATSTKLSPDDVDDLVYACRTGDLAELQELLKTHSQTLCLSEAEIIATAIDADEDGLGSQACLLHYPAANGNLEIVTFLLDRISSPSVGNSSSAAGTAQENATGSHKLINHQNINGNTPLHWAALNGHMEVVQALVKAGADPTIVNEAGRDAVVEAEYSSKDSATECAHWLLKECEALETGAGGHGATGEGQKEQEDAAIDQETESESKSNEQIPNGINGDKHD